MAKRTPRLAVVAVLAVASALLAQVHAAALPSGAPKIGMVCLDGTLTGTTRHFNLVANTGDILTPDGNTVFMWSYANADAPDNGHFQSPGPVLCANTGETVEVHLRNTLPESTSIVFPGQDSAVTATGGTAGLFTTEAGATTGEVTYSFTASEPGTYLYESGSDPAKQIEMGLYGALVIRPSGAAGTAYGTSATQFDTSREYLLLLADISPGLHLAVKRGQAYDITTRHDRYFTINGRSFPDTIQSNGAGVLPNQPYGALVRVQPMTSQNQPALVRMINVGLDNHPFHPHGNHTTQIAQDGRPMAPTEHFGETVGSGQTEDFLLRWDDVDQWNPGGNPFPTTQPNYRNLTFKDGNTFYSGSPYLGYKGTLPTGTVSQNVCGEWYFPWHSHALNEFTNFDEGFGGMGTLLRVDPPGGCFAAPTSTALVGGTLKSGSVSALATADTTYYQVNPKSTTKSGSMSAGAATMTVASASGFPTSGSYYVRVQNEVMLVTGGQGTTTWNVTRGQLGTTASSHDGTQTVTALATDWTASFSAVPTGAQHLKLTYAGKNCGNTSGTGCTSLTSNLPQQTVKVCNFAVAPVGCPTSTSPGWTTLPAPPTQPAAVGSTDVTGTWSLPSTGTYVGASGTYKGQVKVLVHTQRWTPSNPTPFSTWGNLMQLVYDAP